MKLIGIVFVVITLAVVTVIGVSFISPVFSSGIQKFLSPAFNCGDLAEECCPGEWCDTGMTCVDGICEEDFSIEIFLDDSFLIYDPETTSRIERDEYLNFRTPDALCSGSFANCQECYKLFDFRNARGCDYCSVCDEEDSTCGSCILCDSADDDGDGNDDYEELFECFECSGCGYIVDDLSGECGQCAYCNGASITYAKNGLSCPECYMCEESTGGECWSCYDCGSEQNKVCDACTRPGSTSCDIESDYGLCLKLKECIKYYNGEPCEIETFLPLPMRSGYSFSTEIKRILSSCISEDIKAYLPEGGEQFICKYDNTKVDYVIDDRFFVDPSNFVKVYFEGDGQSYVTSGDLKEMLTFNYMYNSLTGENAGLLFDNCGYVSLESLTSPSPRTEVIFHNDPVIFSSSTTPRTDEDDIPVNLKMVLSSVSFNEQSDNICEKQNIFVCAQEAIAEHEGDGILNFYQFFGTFNESYYLFDKNTWQVGDIDVTGLRYRNLFNISLEDRNADVAHIAKAIIAGLKDWMFLSSETNDTIEFFCVNSGLYPTLEECLENEVSVYLNDRTPWRLESFSGSFDTLSEVPLYRYIYYDQAKPSYNKDVMASLTLFVYTSDFDGLKNKIFVSPVVLLKPEPETCAEAGGRCLDPVDCIGDRGCKVNYYECDSASTCCCPLYGLVKEASGTYLPRDRDSWTEDLKCWFDTDIKPTLDNYRMIGDSSIYYERSADGYTGFSTLCLIGSPMNPNEWEKMHLWLYVPTRNSMDFYLAFFEPKSTKPQFTCTINYQGNGWQEFSVLLNSCDLTSWADKDGKMPFDHVELYSNRWNNDVYIDGLYFCKDC